MKITAKQLNGYYRAKNGEGLSANDAWNKDKFGITWEVYHAINNAHSSIGGAYAGIQTLKAINEGIEFSQRA